MRNIVSWSILVTALTVVTIFQPESRIDAASFTVTNANDSGIGSLRQAITDANATAGTDTIDFNIPGAGPHTIQPLSALPAITDPVIIDGYTEPGASPNTNPPGMGTNAVLKIELDGSNAGSANGLTIVAGDSLVRGIAVNRFGGDGFQLFGNGNNIVQGSFLGIDVAGSSALGNSAMGVRPFNSSNNTIGGSAPETRNLISGNGVCGVELLSGASDNLVQGNLIGTDAGGLAAVGNAKGICISSPGGSPSANNVVGGTVEAERNVISGNGLSGLDITYAPSTGNLVIGNYIGTDVTGTVSLGNGDRGVIINGASGNTVGGTDPSTRNIISANGSSGVGILGGATGNSVQGNFIGTDVTGTVALGNAAGVSVGSNSNTVVERRGSPREETARALAT